MKIESEIRIWKTLTLSTIFTSAISIGSAYFLYHFNLIDAIGMQWLSSMALALAALGLGSFSVVKTLQSEKRIQEMELKEIQRKLSMFQVENNNNIELIQDLISKKKHFFPQKLLDKKLSQPKKQKYLLTTAERKQIKGLWIPKEEFSFNYSLQVIELGHFFEKNFILKIHDYIKKGKKMNDHKYICQHWALSRGVPNPDETKNYYNALDNAKIVTDDMRDSITQQFQNFLEE